MFYDRTVFYLNNFTKHSFTLNFRRKQNLTLNNINYFCSRADFVLFANHIEKSALCLFTNKLIRQKSNSKTANNFSSFKGQRIT